MGSVKLEKLEIKVISQEDMNLFWGRNCKLCLIVKLGSRSKVYLKPLIRDLDLELVAIIAMSPTTTTHP